MIRNPSIRRIIVALFLLVGPLTQFQTLFACELMAHDQPRTVCCCDTPGDGGVLGCEFDGSCQDQAGVTNGGCCDRSYQPSSMDQASGSSVQSQQLLLLDAPQPPPIAGLFEFPEIAPPNHSIRFFSHSFSPLPHKPVYLLTKRFRI